MVGGKRTCKFCHKKFYKAELVNRNYSYWCQPCWQKRENKINKQVKKGNQPTYRVYKPTITKFTRIPGALDYTGADNLKRKK